MGRIKISGYAIQQINPITLRKNIGYITEKINIINISIRENFKIVSKDISNKEIIEALVDVGCWNYVKDLPNDLDFLISANGENLPPNIRFLILLAINLVKAPKIFMIDNIPHEVLNPDNDFDFVNFIKTKLKDKTVLVITNRSDIVKQADISYTYLKRGQVTLGEPKEMIELATKMNIEIF